MGAVKEHDGVREGWTGVVEQVLEEEAIKGVF